MLIPGPAPASSAVPISSATEPTAQVASAAELSQPVTPAMQKLLSFKDSDVKFSVPELMSILSDRRHEGWVLAAYPDPKTSHPLIGAGFSLDLPARDHPQTDASNPKPFIEPSSDELWRASGLDQARLNTILDRFSDRMTEWKKRGFRRRMTQLEPDISDADADKLLRIAIIQSIDNARAYCRMFDQLTASQQMALSQLVFQMGVNLEEFTQFLSVVNDLSYRDSAQLANNAGWELEHWKMVQSTLIQSQWARRYTTRAVSVIAMFDPAYEQDPREAERKVQDQIRPKVTHHRKKARVRSVRAGSDSTPHETVHRS